MGKPRQEDYPGGTTPSGELPYDHPKKKSIMQEPPISVGGNLKMKKVKEMLDQVFFDPEKVEEKINTTLNLLDVYLNEKCKKGHVEEDELNETENEIEHVPEEDPHEHLMQIKKDIAETKQLLSKLVEETEYQKFFKSMLDKYGVNSPAELDDEKKKEFFDAVDAGWKGENESD